MSERPNTDAPKLGWCHVRKEDLRAGSAREVNPPFASFDVVLRRDYDALAAELLAVTEALRAASATMWRVSKYDRMTISHAAELQACAKELDRLAAHGDTPEPPAPSAVSGGLTRGAPEDGWEYESGAAEATEEPT